MASGGSEEDPKLKFTKAMIRSVLMSVKEGVLASRFLSDYRSIACENIPFRDLGYSTLEDFIRSMPDVVSVKMTRGELTYFAVADDSTQHLQELIAKQKSAPKKNKLFKKNVSRFPKHHSHGGRAFSTRPLRPSLLATPRYLPSRRFESSEAPRYFTPPRARSPILPTPAFNQTEITPLTITVGGDSHTTRRRIISGSGRHMIHQAVKAAVEQKSPSAYRHSSYEKPPRFQKRDIEIVRTFTVDDRNVSDTEKTSEATSQRQNIYSAADKPVAVVAPNPHKDGPEVDENQLPDSVKSWTAELLKGYESGLWYSRYAVLYKENFGADAPGNLVKLMENWTSVVKVEWNTVANRNVLFPVKEQPAVTVTASKSAWKTFNIPCAELFETGMTTFVFATFVKDLGDFYVQREDSTIENINDTMNEICKTLDTPSLSDLKPGVFCCALYSADSSWYRARVLLALPNTNEVQVLFVDYGNMEKVPVANIRSLPETLVATPSQAVPCKLFGLKPFEGDGWSQEAIDVFGDMMKDQLLEAKTLHVGDARCVIELFAKNDSDANISINQQLFERKVADTYLPRLPSVLSVPVAEESYLPVIVAYIDLCNCWIRFEGPDYSDKLESLEDELASLYELGRNQHRRLQQGCVCIVNWEGSFYRVRIEDIEEDQANCFFVDHGYTKWFSLDNLVLLDGSVNCRLPYQAMQCVLYGLEDNYSDPTYVNELLSRTKDKICLAEVYNMEPLTLMMFDTSGEEDININEEIAKRLIREKGINLDTSIFTASSADSSSERGSTASSPRPNSQTDLDQELSAATVKLRVTEEGTQTDDVLLGLGSNASSAASSISGPSNASSAASSISGLSSASSAGSSISGPSNASSVASSISGPSMKKYLPDSTANSFISTSFKLPDHGDCSVSLAAADANATQVSGKGDSISLAFPSAMMPLSGNNGINETLVPNDPMCVTYSTWTLPKRLPPPKLGEFFVVFVQSVSDPSNFVVIPQSEQIKLEELMKQLDICHNPKLAAECGMDLSLAPQLICVPEPIQGHLYMVSYDGTYYRAIFVKRLESLLHVLLADFCHHIMIDAKQVFFLPKQFWTLPFSAHRASLSGVRPAGLKNSAWSEAVKYEFTRLAQGKTLYALVKGISLCKGEGPCDSLVAQVSRQILSLHLIDTTLPDRDIILSEALIEVPHLGVLRDA